MRQQLIDFICTLRRQACEKVVQIRVRIMPVELRLAVKRKMAGGHLVEIG